METKEVLYDLRTKKGLSQDELAEKVFVTRQAVSRWETGETIPSTDTLKLLSSLYRVSINTLLGAPRQLFCQCCGMPLTDDIIGNDKDGSLNEDYCKWCYADGTYTYSNMDDLINVCIGPMKEQGFTEEQARAHLQETLPTLDYWKRYEELSDNGQFEAFKQQLICEINDLNIQDRAEMLGHITDASLLDALYARASVFAFPSLYDAAPMVVREAAVMKTPSVMVRGSTAAEVIRPGENGFLCENTPEDLAREITQALSDPDALRRIGEFSKAKKVAEVAALYAKESILPKILDFQIKLIENKDTGRYTVADALKSAR